jgi:hypothetical protein
VTGQAGFERTQGTVVTGIKISEMEAETLTENGVTKIKNPETGKWEILE